MLARLYLRASTDEQDASRARSQLDAFAAQRGLMRVWKSRRVADRATEWTR
jgi:DNA invertase Pin-like site-specific DNA recombinase